MKRTNEVKSQNSSIDSIGEDLSFDENEKPKGRMAAWQADEYIDYKTLKNKRDLYLTGKSSIIKKKLNESTEELENPGWSSIFATFFNNRKKDNISLNELDLRCKYSSKCDEIEKQMRKGKKGSVMNSLTMQSFPPHANLKEFIDKISIITADSTVKLSNRKSMELLMAKQSMRLASRKNPNMLMPKKSVDKDVNKRPEKIPAIRSNTSMIPFMNRAIANKKFNNEADYKFSSRHEDSKLRNSKTTNEITMTPPEITKPENNFNTENNNRAMIPRRTSNLLDLYDIKDAPVMLKSILNKNLKQAKKTKVKKESPPKKNSVILNDASTKSVVTSPIKTFKISSNASKFDEETFNHILANKNSFNVELERYSTILNKKVSTIKGNSLIEYKHLLDFKDSELYFEVVSVKNGSMLKRYKDESAKIDKISKLVEKFERNICCKFDPTKKIEI
jgi:hypothetical protein